MQNSSRIILNTGILYSKMFLNIFIALYSTRLILNALGTNDFGIYALVGGVIGALSFLNKAMATATQRYLSYNRGKGTEQLGKVFNTSLILHVLIGILFVIVLEICGLFLFDGFLNIESSRLAAAKFVFHCMAASTFFSVIAVPYDAIMNAKENMLVFSLFSVLESVLKLLIAIYLFYTPVDKLMPYGLLMALMMDFCRTFKRLYSDYKYKETKIRLGVVDFKLLKEMAGYSGWITVESVCHIAKGEGIPVVLNLFFGTGVNAAYGVSTQVRHNIGSFSEMIFKSSNPQVMRNIGDGFIDKSIKLSTTVCKFSYLLMALLSIPLIIEADFILSLWLKNVPDYAANFCRLVLGTNLMIMLARGLNFLIDGIGKIKVYRITLSVLNLIVFPIALVLLKMGASPYSVFIGIFFSDFLVVVARVYFAAKYSGMNASEFCKSVPFRLAPLTMLILCVLWKLPDLFHLTNWENLIFTLVVSSVLQILTFYLFVLDKNEKKFVFEFMGKIKRKLCRT